MYIYKIFVFFEDLMVIYVLYIGYVIQYKYILFSKRIYFKIQCNFYVMNKNNFIMIDKLIIKGKINLVVDNLCYIVIIWFK